MKIIVAFRNFANTLKNLAFMYINCFCVLPITMKNMLVDWQFRTTQPLKTTQLFDFRENVTIEDLRCSYVRVPSRGRRYLPAVQISQRNKHEHKQAPQCVLTGSKT
jgi:hypothetical protein